MGANAQTSVPAFTAGQILTAQQQTEINTGIPVFATTTTRDAAFGGTGEKTLAEGQFAYIEATNTTQYYDGAAWQPVGTPPGMVYLTGASFSAVTSVSLPTNTFTSTYDNYKIFFTVTNFSTGALVFMRFRTNGTDNTADAYRYGGVGLYSTGASTNTNGDAGNTAFGNMTDANTEFCHIETTIMRPLNTSAIKQISSTNVWSRSNAPYFGWRVYGASINSSALFDAVTYHASAGNFTGSYKVYGLVNS